LRCTSTGSTFTGVLDAFMAEVPGVPVVATVTVEAPQSRPVSASIELLWDVVASLVRAPQRVVGVPVG
jgi:hypothetical protein